jgi:hypothetical protein
MSDHTKAIVSALPPCDFCSQAGYLVNARFDGKTEFGPWANMCAAHFDAHGTGLGLGRGQELVLPEDGSV